MEGGSFLGLRVEGLQGLWGLRVGVSWIRAKGLEGLQA